MNEPREELDPHWEAQINALVDGELDAADVAQLEEAARDKPALAAALENARALQQLLGVMPKVKATKRLRRKLQAISKPPGLMSPAYWPWLRGGVAMACLALLVLVINPGTSNRPSEAEIEQGRRELAMALSYLNRASEKTNLQISRRINGAMLDPLTQTTTQALSLEQIMQPLMQQEYEL